ncbi:cytochrome P450 [Streptomyces sp. NBC_01276]|uniref:cytochrome P450 n=1 Tax=Streptomyces sp. NBC_01276 TaxID=2903808 RepID=UPI00352CE2E0
MEFTTTRSPSDAPPFPQPRVCPYQPPPEYERLSGQGPLSRVTLFDGRVVWLVTGYPEARQLLADRRISADRQRPDYPAVAPRFQAEVAKRLVLIGMDPPAHDEHRQLLNPYFSRKRVEELRPVVQGIVDHYVDRMLETGPPADLVRDFALPVPSRVISEILGLPAEDLEFFQEASRCLLQATTREESQKAGGELVGYLDRLAALRRTEPGPGLIGLLAREEVEAGRLSHADLVQMALVILVAGHETSASTIALGTITLLDHPELLARMRTDPAGVPAAVEEILRCVAVTDLAGVRVATEDVPVAGEVIRAGEGVLLSATMANRDPRVHEEPAVFDTGRTGRRHLSFGYGIHQCLGQSLARMELEVAFATLFERIPTLRLAVPADRLPTRPPGSGTVQGVNEMPVTW